MKYILGCLGALFTLSSCYQTQRNCKDFQEGTFVFEQEIDGALHRSVFERNLEYQIETYQGKIDTATVRWVNDCEFILEKINPKNREEQKAIHMKILTTSDDGYVFEYGIVGDTKKQKGEVKKITQNEK